MSPKRTLPGLQGLAVLIEGFARLLSPGQPRPASWLSPPEPHTQDPAQIDVLINYGLAGISRRLFVLLFPLVKHHSHPLDMLYQPLMGNLAEQREVYLVREQ